MNSRRFMVTIHFNLISFKDYLSTLLMKRDNINPISYYTFGKPPTYLTFKYLVFIFIQLWFLLNFNLHLLSGVWLIRMLLLVPYTVNTKVQYCFNHSIRPILALHKFVVKRSVIVVCDVVIAFVQF